MGIGLNKNFNKKNRDASEQHIRGQNQMGSIDHNPLDESDEKEDKKLLTEQ